MPDLNATIQNDDLSGSLQDDLLIATLFGGFPNVLIPTSGITWNRVATAPTLLNIGQGYIIDSAVPVTIPLPETPKINDYVLIYRKGAGRVTLSQRIGERITGMGESTTLGVTGSCEIYDPGGWVFLLYAGSGIWELTGGFAGNLILN